jgi:hypothetical protein
MSAKIFTAAFALAIGLSTSAFAQQGANPRRAMNGNGAPGANRPIERLVANGQNNGNGAQDAAGQLRGGVGANQFGNRLNPLDLLPQSRTSGPSGLNINDQGEAIATTPTGDYLRGTSRVIASTGEAVKNVSEAAINGEVAKKLYIDNNYKATEVYWEKKRLWAENSAYQRGTPLSADQLRQIAADAAPDRLSVLQLQPLTGEINWPAALLRPEFANLRSKVEEVFENRTVSNTGVGSTAESAVARLTDTMQDNLKAQIDDLTPNEYVAAKGFLRSLEYETRFMPGVEGVAQR